jgi:hypothetical protein
MLKITPIDNDKVTGGVWTSYMGVQLKIARSNNDNFIRKFKLAIKPVQRDHDQGLLNDEQMADLLCGALAGAVLTDWDFGEHEFNVENAKQLMINDPDCRVFVQEFSGTMANYFDSEKEDVKGKS